MSFCAFPFLLNFALFWNSFAHLCNNTQLKIGKSAPTVEGPKEFREKEFCQLTARPEVLIHCNNSCIATLSICLAFHDSKDDSLSCDANQAANLSFFFELFHLACAMLGQIMPSPCFFGESGAFAIEISGNSLSWAREEN